MKPNCTALRWLCYVTSWLCDETPMWRVDRWRVDHVTRWPRDELTGSPENGDVWWGGGNKPHYPPTREFGKCCKLPWWGPRQSPRRSWFGCILRLQTSLIFLRNTLFTCHTWAWQFLDRLGSNSSRGAQPRAGGAASIAHCWRTPGSAEFGPPPKIRRKKCGHQNAAKL